MGDRRAIVETGIEARVAEIVEPEIEDLGYRLVRVKMSAHNGSTLQIMAERPDGTMNVEGCEKISKAISPVLDIEDPISHAYNLEVSSPGIDRPMVRLSDFSDWIGHVCKLETHQLVDGRKRFKGTIVGVEGGMIKFRRDDAGKDEDPAFAVSVNDIKNAKLVMTDELVDEALKRDKSLREANGIEDGEEPSPTKH